jgi:lipoate-protein ligase A
MMPPDDNLLCAAPVATWRILNEGLAATPEAGVAADFRLLDAVAAGEEPATIRLWENRPCLVVSGRDTRLPHFDEACRDMAGAGWPVLTRRSGGTSVPHGDGVLLVSMVHALEGRVADSVDRGYEALCTWMVEAIATLGIHADCRSVPAAFCDGRYNLAVGPRKIAGTAQRWRRRTVGGVTRQGVIAHALLLVEGDPHAMTEAVNRFYTLAGDPRHFDAQSVTTIARCLKQPSDIMARIRRALVDAAAKQPIPQ